MADEDRNYRGDEQTVGSTNITNRYGNPNVRTNAYGGDQQI